jgi:hypothetical protein
MGRPMYERLGFRLETVYHSYVAPARESSATRVVRDLRPVDTPAILAADRDATGEDRSELVSAIAAVGTGWVLPGADGSIRGHVLRAPWGGGSTIAADPKDALALLEHRRSVAAADGTVRCGILDGNATGRRLLEAAGWTLQTTHPRLVRGPELDWRPDAIWGQFNFALG